MRLRRADGGEWVNVIPCSSVRRHMGRMSSTRGARELTKQLVVEKAFRAIAWKRISRTRWG